MHFRELWANSGHWNTFVKIARKVNFAIQLLRETAELLEAPVQPVQERCSRYRRSIERDE